MGRGSHTRQCIKRTVPLHLLLTLAWRSIACENDTKLRHGPLRARSALTRLRVVAIEHAGRYM